MAETASTVPPKGLGAIQINDVWKGIITAALTNVLLSLYSVVNTGAWPTHADLQVMLKSTVAIVLSYLIKNLATNNVGQLLKPDKPIVHVDANDLQKLENKAAENEIVTSKTTTI